MAKLIYATPTSLDGYIADENYLATPATNYLLRRVFRPHRRFPPPSRASAGRVQGDFLPFGPWSFAGTTSPFRREELLPLRWCQTIAASYFPAQN